VSHLFAAAPSRSGNLPDSGNDSGMARKLGKHALFAFVFGKMQANDGGRWIFHYTKNKKYFMVNKIRCKYFVPFCVHTRASWVHDGAMYTNIRSFFFQVSATCTQVRSYWVQDGAICTKKIM